MSSLHRGSDGKLATYAWPGGYPVFYLCADGGTLCPSCANGENGSMASEDADTPADWRLVASGINWEDDCCYCDHCSKQIESAYGDR